ncbi:C25 family cysteine peptidase [Promethearchaeum syntrophicum]|uniref:C25 family cysteine peptidase n=1 Tax=Promethearchaeum syntrophicum TaxID=2594042 RepID=A0A5B9DG42_9ARCH|nr:C25 family cysteine peptidase [Candidatus Prometheoarchaeum syntrophicum]
MDFSTKGFVKMSRRRSYRIIIFSLILVFITSPLINLGPSPFTLISSVKALDSTQIDKIISELPRDEIIRNESEWLPNQYEMLLISPDNSNFVEAAQVFADWKKLIGIPTLVVANWSDYAGIDGPEQIRNAIKYYYNLYPIKWILLLGDTELIPIRYVYNPDSLLIPENEPVGDPYEKPSDYYYAELTSNWDIDGDGKWGEHSAFNSSSSISELDYNPEVYVGRFPVDNISELHDIFNKTMNYEAGINAGDWMNKYLALSGISDYPTTSDMDGEDEGVLNQYILDNFVDDSMEWTHMLDYTYAYTPVDSENVLNLTKTTALEAINNGTSIIVYAGHGGPTSFAASGVLSTSDVPQLSNQNMPSFIFADACSTNSYDYSVQDSLGETLINQPNTGAVGYIGSMRLSWYLSNDTYLEQFNRGLTKLFFNEMFINNNFQQGKALYESKKAYANTSWFNRDLSVYDYFEMDRKSILSYMLLGDPSVYIYTETAQIFSPLFPEGIVAYEGGKYVIQIKSEFGISVPNAKLTLWSEDGHYRVFNADEQGNMVFTLPLGSRSYNYSLSAHNMIYYSGIVNTEIDNKAPMIEDTQIAPNKPKANDFINFNTTLNDYGLGICYGFLIFSKDDFNNYTYYPLIPKFKDCEYEVELKLEDGDYQYGIVSFDYMDNYNSTLYTGASFITISPAPQEILTIGISIILFLSVIAVTGIIAYFMKKKKIFVSSINIIE